MAVVGRVHGKLKHQSEIKFPLKEVQDKRYGSQMLIHTSLRYVQVEYRGWNYPWFSHILSYINRNKTANSNA